MFNLFEFTNLSCNRQTDPCKQMYAHGRKMHLYMPTPKRGASGAKYT